MSQSQRFQAKIAGKEYTITGNKSTEHMVAVVDLINQQLDQLSNKSPQLSFVDRYALMAVNAVSTQIDQEETIIELEEKIQELNNQIQDLKSELKALTPKNNIAPRESLSQKVIKAVNQEENKEQN